MASDETDKAGGGEGLVGALVAASAAIYAAYTTGAWTTAIGKIVTAVVVTACAVWGIQKRRYVLMLQAAGLPENARDRQPYAELRARLETGGTPSILYKRWLTKVLAQVDRFVGDGNPEAYSQTFGQRAFGLVEPAPLWTTASFTFCAAVAAFYPIATMVVLWAITGHTGTAGAILNFPDDNDLWTRVAGMTALGLMTVSYRAHFKATGWRVSGLFYLAMSIVLGGWIVFGWGGARLPWWYMGFCGASFACLNRLYMTPNYRAPYHPFSKRRPWVNFPFGRWYRRAKERGYLGRYVICVYSTVIILCFLSPLLIARDRVLWEDLYGPLLLFFGLLTLVNAPFDWFSFGLTRALLRRGLERGGWWPFFYSLFDASFTVGVIAALAVAMLFSVQAFDALGIHVGGRALVNLTELFSHLSDVEQPENWWIYVTLFSTMIPSVLNLCIGATALLRGAPFVTRWLVRMMPATGAVPRANIEVLALVLTGQGFLGAGLAILAQSLLFFGLLGYLLPWIGLDLLNICENLAKSNFPGRALHLVAGG